MHVVVVQPDVREYRKKIFSLLGNDSRISSFRVLIPNAEETHHDGFSVHGIAAWSKNGFFFLRGGEEYLDAADVIIAVFDVKWSCTLLWPFGRHRNKLVFWGHGFGRTRNHPISRILRIFLAKQVKAIVFYDRISMMEFIDAGKINPAKCFVAPNTMVVSNHAAPSGLSKSERLLFVGRLIPEKNVSMLIEAAHLLKEKNKKVRVDIVGEGAERNKLEKLTADLGLTQEVVFHGAVYDEYALRELFHGARAYVCTGPAGLGVVHSMAYGIPVVMYETSQHGPEVIYCTKENSIFYNESLDDLVKKLESVLTDDSLCEKLSRGSYKTYIEDCSPGNMVEGFLKAVTYAKVI